MSEDPNFKQYCSPNIVIIPNMSNTDDKPLSTVSEAKKKSSSADTTKSIPILIQRTTSNSDSVKNKSWATNYLQSIGLTYDKSILKRKFKMNTNENDTNSFLRQDSSSTTVANVNLPIAMPDINYDNNVYNSSSDVLGNNTAFPNYNTTAPSLNIGATMPTTTYTNPYVNENNNYCYNQTTNVVENNGPSSTYYNSISTPITTVDANLASTYSNNFGQPVINYTYYNTNENSYLEGVNMSAAYTDPYLNQNNSNDFGQPVTIPKNNVSISMTSGDVNKTTTITDDNLPTSKSTSSNESNNTDTLINFNQPNTTYSHNILSKTQSTCSNLIEKPKCCDCTCLKLKQNVKQNIEEKNQQSKHESTVMANERKFRDFLQKLNMPNPYENKNKQVVNEEKFDCYNSTKHISTNSDRNKIKPKQKEEFRPKFIKTKYVDEQEPEYIPVKKAKIDSNYEMTNYKDYRYRPVFKRWIDSSYENKKYTTTESKSTIMVQKRSKVKLDDTERKSKKARQSKSTILVPKRTKDKPDDTERKVKKAERECKKYYSENRKEKRKISPVKSVVNFSKNREKKKSPRTENEDLRDRLSRKLHKKDKKLKNKQLDIENHKQKCPEGSSEKFIITVNNNRSENKKSPEKAKVKCRSNKESCKKVNLVINIVYKQPGSRTESDKSDSDDHSPQPNADLSFLDDFNVDEIVASLNKSENIGLQKRGLQEQCNTTVLEGSTSFDEIDTRNDKIKNENMEFVTAKEASDKGNILNNLLSREACLLDNLRLLHQEIESERQCMHSKFKTEAKQLFVDGEVESQGAKHVKYQLGQIVLKDEKVTARSVKEDLSNNESTKSAENIKCSSPNNFLSNERVNQKSDETMQHLSPVTILMEHIKRCGTNAVQNDLSNPIRENISNENFNNSIEDRSPKTKSAIDNNLNVSTIIDLLHDDSNDNNIINTLIKSIDAEKIDDLNLVRQQPRDKLIDTIDLTNNRALNESIDVDNFNDVSIIAQRSRGDLVDTIDLTIDENSNNQVEMEDTSLNPVKSKEDEYQKESLKTLNTDEEILVNKTKENDNLSEQSLIKGETLQDIKEFLENNKSKDTTTNEETTVYKLKENASQDVLSNKINIKKYNSDVANSPKDSFDVEVVSNENSIQVMIKDNNATTSEYVANSNVEKVLDFRNNFTYDNAPKVQAALPLTQIVADPDRSSDLKFDRDVDINQLSEGPNLSETSIKQTETTEKSISQSAIVGSNSNVEKSPNNHISDEGNNDQLINKSKTNCSQIDKVNTTVNVNEKQDSEEVNKITVVANDSQKNNNPSPKVIPSTSGVKTNSTLLSEKKNVKIKETNKIATSMTRELKSIQKIADGLQLEMSNCLKQKLTVVGLIHSGAYSKIFHCRNTSIGWDYVVKTINAKFSTYKLANKKDMLFALQSSRLKSRYPCVYILNTFSLNGHLCFLMDYYPKNLRQALEENGKPFHINVVQHLARQLVSAVALLKGHDVVHLDITPTHILLNNAHTKLKLCGFDAARPVDKIPADYNLGTVNYRPPEVIIGYKLGFDIDVWATGLVMYEMATRITLFPGVHNNDILFKQMCTLGELPIEMIHRSRYSHVHFTGSNFKRIIGKSNKKIFNIITKFQRSIRLEATITNTYNNIWRDMVSPLYRKTDTVKILQFIALLKEMLEVNPADRMPIQFVNAHPFMMAKHY